MVIYSAFQIAVHLQDPEIINGVCSVHKGCFVLNDNQYVYLHYYTRQVIMYGTHSINLFRNMYFLKSLDVLSETL
jgi:hypothetical protein